MLLHATIKQAYMYRTLHVQNITCIEEQYMYRTTMHVQNNTCTEQLYMYMVYCVEKTNIVI